MSWFGTTSGQFFGAWFGAAARAVSTAPTFGGVRRARFLRRAPKLPWELDDGVQVAQVSESPRIRRIKLPAQVLDVVQESMPVQAYVETPVTTSDDDELLMMI